MTFDSRVTCTVVIAFGMLAGCAGRTSILPNPNPQLRHSSAWYAADAAKRHPYKADAPRGGQAVARAQKGIGSDRIEIVNLTPDEDWKDVEVWVNKKYVVYVPELKPKKLEVLFYQMFFDDGGN